MSRLVISTQSLQVLASDRNVFTVLGYHPHEINCRSIWTVTGKGSDLRMLQGAIQDMQGHRMQLILYDSGGQERRLIACCSPFYDADVLIGCLLTLHPSEAIMLLDVFTANSEARALVSAEAPHGIHMANDAFLGRFGCSRSEVLGRPLNLLYGYSGAELAHLHLGLFAQLRTETEAAWSALLFAALDGRITQGRLATSSCWQSDFNANVVTCAPVVESLNGRIRHLLITFGPLSYLDDGIEPHPASCANPIPGRAPKKDINPLRVSVRSRARSMEAVIFPRSKPCSTTGTTSVGGRAMPVVVTRDLVAALADLPLPKAAATAGICPTALKRACRKIGVRRWVYKRGRTADGWKAADSGSRAGHRGDNRPILDVPAHTTVPGPDDVRAAARRDHPNQLAALWAGNAIAVFTLAGMAAASYHGVPAAETVLDDALARHSLGMSWPL